MLLVTTLGWKILEQGWDLGLEPTSLWSEMETKRDLAKDSMW